MVISVFFNLPFWFLSSLHGKHSCGNEKDSIKVFYMLQTIRKVKLHFNVILVTTSGYSGISPVFPVRGKNIFILFNFCYFSGMLNLDNACNMIAVDV